MIYREYDLKDDFKDDLKDDLKDDKRWAMNRDDDEIKWFRKKKEEEITK